MFEELRKIMQPEYDAELNAAVNKAVKEAVDKAVKEAWDKAGKASKEAVKEAVTSNTDLVNAHAIDNFIKKFSVSLPEACDALGMTVEKYEEVKAKEAPQELTKPE